MTHRLTLSVSRHRPGLWVAEVWELGAWGAALVAAEQLPTHARAVTVGWELLRGRLFAARYGLQWVHEPEECAPRTCVVHRPSQHRMRNWPMMWRDDRQMVERLCRHGVGHPDPDHLRYRPRDEVHGCDGCCGDLWAVHITCTAEAGAACRMWCPACQRAQR